MHQHIKAAPLLGKLGEHGLDLGRVLHVEGLEQGRPQRCGELAHLALETAFLIRQVGDPELATGGMQLLGNAPSDRLVVGDAGDEGLLAAEVEEHGGRCRRAAGSLGILPQRWAGSAGQPAVPLNRRQQMRSSLPAGPGDPRQRPRAR